MPIDYIPFGNPYPEIQMSLLKFPATRRMLIACEKSKDFEVVELRRLEDQDGVIKEIVVVDCLSDGVLKYNKAGIKKRERIAMVFSSNNQRGPQVRALRKDFPQTAMHLYSVRAGEPAHLCLYDAAWADIERTWTPESFLKRILWWFSGTANGTLHPVDQPVEQMFYQSPYKIILPPDFKDKYSDKNFKLIFQAITPPTHALNVIFGAFIPDKMDGSHKIQGCKILLLDLPPVVHSRPETCGQTLGEIHDLLAARGVDFFRHLKESITHSVPAAGIQKNEDERCLIVMCIPVKRDEDQKPERIATMALAVYLDLASLGEKTGALSLSPQDYKYYVVPSIGKNDEPVPSEWQELSVIQIEIRYKMDRQNAQMASGIHSGSADFGGVIAGVGSLGSALADVWSREAWGHWTLIDHDTVEPHNTVRHIAKDNGIGLPKVDVVRTMMTRNYHEGYYCVKIIADSADNFDNPRVVEALNNEKASLIVDATTTIGFPREISERDDVSRSVSVFLSPSGLSSVLLFESSDRNVRLDVLESQYYRAVINSDWGRSHLKAPKGIRMGRGCRDISLVLSNELILLHAATLARQVRLLRDQANPVIRIWISDPEMGSTDVKNVDVFKSQSQRIDSCDWTVVWDEGTADTLYTLRKKALPNETGGIILGFMDQKIRKICVVDVLDAPSDSISSPDSFIRGKEGVNEILAEVFRRTDGIVGYVGEWHSHPHNAPVHPSGQDMELINELADTLSTDGLPALMVIVAKDDIRFELKGGRND